MQMICYITDINLIILAGLVGVSQAINCYTCSSTGSDCADPFAAAVDKEQDCTAFGYIDDGGCSKLKSYAKVLGIDIYTGMRSFLAYPGNCNL